MGLLLLTSFSRRKKEETYRNELDSKIVAGAKVKTVVEPIVFAIVFMFIFICFARLIDLIKKKTDWARTNKITIPATI